MNWLSWIGKWPLMMCRPFAGRIAGEVSPVVPKSSSIDAWRVSRTPSEETSLASGDAVRSGRNAMNSIARPTITVQTIVSTMAGTAPMV